MKTQEIVKSACLVAGLIILAACITTKESKEWRAADGANASFGHIMVIALFKQDQTRRMFEDEFAWQISNQGQMVTRSYNLAPSLNENTTARIASLAKAVGADGILAIRMVKGLQQPPAAAEPPPPAPMNLSGFLQYSWKDNYDPPDLTSNAVMTVESRLFDARNGKLTWSLVTESKNQLGYKWEINLLAKRVLGRIKDAMQTK